jgi:surface protein
LEHRCCDNHAVYHDLSSWNTGAVTTMSAMFRGASSFNNNISDWNTSSVTNMRRMFYEAIAFNQDLSNWNVEAVTTMFRMFYQASAFNQTLCWTLKQGVFVRNMFLGSLGGSFDSSCL